MSRLSKLRLNNFKGKRSEWVLAPKMLLIGPNGAGKSAVLQAVMVGILGYEPRLGRTPASVVQLASGREMSVELETEGKFLLHRSFKMSQGMVSTSVRVSPYQGEKNLADAHRRILEEVGDFAVAFDLNAFLTLSDAKKRAFLFGLSPMKSGRWDRGELKGRLIQAVRAPVSSLMLHAWIDKAFALWSDRLDMQSNLDRMLSFLKKEYSIWTLRKKEGVATARQMLSSRNQDPLFFSEGARAIQKKIEEITERLIQVREELAKDEERRKRAASREKEITAYREKIARGRVSSDAESGRGAHPLSELKGRLFDPSPLEAEISRLEEKMVFLAGEIDAEEKKENDLKVSLEIEERGVERAETVRGQCPVMEGVACPVDFTRPIQSRRERLAEGRKRLEEIEQAQRLRWDRYRVGQERLGVLRAERQLLVHRENETKAQIDGWERLLREQEEGFDQAVQALARLEDEEAADGGYADPDDLMIQKEGLERQLEEKKGLLAEQEGHRSLWIAYQQNQVEIKKAEANVEALKKILSALGPKGLQGEIMKEIVRPFSKIVNDLLHSIDPQKELAFRFQDGRGNEIFEMGWKKGEQFIPFEALSTGERVLFSAAFMTGLIIFREPRCRMLLVDNLESVDLFHRRRFMEALCRFVDEGHLDHVIAAGVEGIPPEEAARLGLQLIEMAPV